MRKSVEHWNTRFGREARVVVRTAQGTFDGLTNTGGFSLEIWDTAKGSVVKIAQRDEAGRFLGGTNV